MKFNTIEKIGLKWGILSAFALAGYFVGMVIFDLIHILELRLLNAGIMFFAVYKATKEAKYTFEDFTYLKGLGTGLATATIGSSIFAIFGFIYLSVINPEFIEFIRDNELFGSYINKYGASLQIFIEGTFSGCLLSYASMQRLKIGKLDFKQKVVNHQDN
ncbi:MAG: DUF4199 domain-containing protein [Fulvivirga sp.]